MTELYIFWGEIQIPTKKDSLWLQKWDKLTSFVGIFQFRTEEDSLVLKWFQKWQYLTFFVGTFKFRLTEPRIFYLEIQILTEKKNSSVSKWYQRWSNLTSDPVWGHSNSKWEMHFSIEMTSKISELYILCGSIQIQTEEDSLVLKWLQRWQNLTFIVGTFKLQLTEPYILFWEIQISTETDSWLSKWLQRWQKLTSFVGHLNNNKKKTVWFWNDHRNDRTMHPLWWHSNSDWKISSVLKWF